MQLDHADALKESLAAYRQAWVALLQSVPSLSLEARATTLSVKVADKAALYQMIADNDANIEQIHIGTVNDRYIASCVLKQAFQGLPILKILERRPGSDDPLGLDSLDYLVTDTNQAFQTLKAAKLPVVKESNDVHAWLSLRFGDVKQYEAKFTDHLVIGVAIKEMQIAEAELLKKSNQEKT